MIEHLAIICARLGNAFYGYEAINLCLRWMPSRGIIAILRYFGANVGQGVRIQPPFILHNADQQNPPFKNLLIGDDCYIGRYCLFDLEDLIQIGNQVTISHRVTLNTHTNAGKSPLSAKVLCNSHGPISIEDGVYLGLNVTLLQHVQIGQNTLIGANALVTKSIPGEVMAFGQPCKVQKNIDV